MGKKSKVDSLDLTTSSIILPSQVLIVTGGFIDNKRSSLTEMMTDNKRWEIIPTARLPVPLVESAALTINNKVYIFGKRSLVVAQSIGCLKGGNGGRETGLRLKI